MGWFRRIIGGFEFILFCFGLALLSMLYGVASVRYEIFPYPTLMYLKSGVESLWKLEPADLPANVVMDMEPTAPSQPIETFGPQPREDAILIAGGFYQKMDTCPEHGCMAWIIDRNGTILHAWSADPAHVLAGLDNLDGEIDDLSIYISGLALAPDGGLVTVFQGRNTFPYQVGIARFDKAGTLLWKHFDHAHHWPTIDTDGTIFAPSVRFFDQMEYFGNTRTELECEGDLYRSEGVRTYAPDGTVLRDFWMDDILAASDYPGLAHAIREGCNPHHVNGIAVLTDAAAERFTRAKPGDLAVSLREPSLVAILDRETGALRHMVQSRFSAQHSPGFLSDGSLMVFDNRGGNRELGGSRIVAIDPLEDKLRTIFPEGDEGQPVLPFFSRSAGVVSANADKSRILISDSRQGRVIEVDVESSDPIWLYEKTLDIGPFLAAKKGDPGDRHMVRFSTQGAYYVPRDHPVFDKGG